MVIGITVVSFLGLIATVLVTCVVIIMFLCWKRESFNISETLEDKLFSLMYCILVGFLSLFMYFFIYIFIGLGISFALHD